MRTARDAVSRSQGEPGAVRDLASLYHANGLYREARQCYDVLVRGGTELSAKDNYYVADAALQAGDAERAIHHLKKVLQEEPNYLPARVTLALSLLKTGDASGAEREFETVLATDPLHIEATVNLVRLALLQGDETAALNRLERLVTARPEATSAAALLAQLLGRRGEHDRATAYRERSRQRPEPIQPDPWKAELDSFVYDLGLLGLRFEEHAQADDWPRARVFLSRIEELDPNGALAPTLRGSVAARARKHDEAAAHFRTALARGGDPEKLCPVLVASLLARNDTVSALELMERFTTEQPSSLPLLVAYSDVLMRRRDRPETRDILTRVLELQPHLQAQAFALAEILWTKGEYDAAAPYLERVAQAEVKHLASRALLAEHHLRKSEPEAALGWLEQAKALAGAREPAVRQQLAELSLAAQLQRANRAVQNGSWREAARALELAGEVAPQAPQVHAERAKVLVELKDYEGAIESLQKLAALQPDNPTVLLSLGDLCLLQGRSEAALQHWTEARQRAAAEDDLLRAAIDQRLTHAAAKNTFR